MKSNTLPLLFALIAFSVFAAEPQYAKHDKIKGSFLVLTNTEEFVRATVSEASGDFDEKINALSEKVNNDIASAVSFGTNYTHEAVGSLETRVAGLIEELEENAMKWAAEEGNRAECAASNNATNYTDSVAVQKQEEFVSILDEKAQEVSSGLTNYVDGVGSGLSSRIDILCQIMKDTIGDDTNKTIRAISAEEVAKIVSEAPESYDTLREIADWIMNDTTGAAQMANDIEDLKENKADKQEVSDLRLYVDSQISNVYEKATGYFDLAIERYDVYGKAASVSSNTVSEILRPQPLEFRYDGSGDTITTNAVIVPNWATSPMHFTNVSDTNETAVGTLALYSSTSLRNYSVIVKDAPEGMPYMLMQFDALKASHKIYASPSFDPPDGEMATRYGISDQYILGWVLTREEMPCSITLREPEEGLLIVRRETLEGN